MNENFEEQKTRKPKRILALILSGIYVLIVLPIVGIFVSLYLDSLIGWSQIIPYPFNMIVAVIFLATGFLFGIWSNIEIFRTGKGSPVPLKGTHTTELVIKGPYKYSRNPMVFGYILFWLGLGFAFNSPFLTIGFAAFVTIILIILVKLWEEKNMTKRFGNAYVEYKKGVSFLIPFPSKKKSQLEI
ncbi:MAG: methyltransferase family protein [Candidatus Hermodarchaeota archaeon]